MAAAMDLEGYTHREVDKTPNKSKTRRIGTHSPERGGQTTNAVVNEENVSNNGRIITRGDSNSSPTEYHSGTSELTRGNSNSNPT